MNNGKTMPFLVPLVLRGALGLTLSMFLLVVGAVAVAAPGPTSSEAELLAILEGDAPEAEKALACKFMAVSGSPAAVPAVAPLLANPRLASWARITLEAIPGDEASAALRAAAGSLEGRLLAGVISSLGVRQETAAVPLIAGRLADDDAQVAAAAAWALGQIATPEAGLLLVGGIEKAAGPERQNALAEAAVLCAANFHAAGMSDEAVALYGVVRAADVSTQRRAEAIRGTIIAKGAAGLPLLVETLRSPTARLANMAVFTARGLGRGEEADDSLALAVDAVLIGEVESASAAGDQSRAAILIDILAERNAGRGSELVIASFSKAAEQGAKPIRLAAIEALGRAGDAAVVGPLLLVAADEDAGLADTARDAIATLSGDAVDQEIVKRLVGADATALPVLVELVGRRRIAAVAELLPLLDHPDGTVRTATLVAFGPTIDLTNLDVLVAAATVPKSEAEGEAARAALLEASVRMPDREACAAKLAAAFERASGEAKVLLLDIIGEVGGTKAVETMAVAGRSGEASLEDAATRLLGKWMTADAAPVLLEIATVEPASRFKTRALRGYLRIARQFVLPDAERAAMCRRALAAATEEADRKGVLEILVRYPSVETLAVAKEAAKISGLEEEAKQATEQIQGKLTPAKKAG